MKICDDKNACKTLDWEVEVKDIPVGENAKPIINSVDIYSPADFVDGKIAVTWGKNFGGKINATDLENDVITYEIDASGDGLYSPSINGNEFLINTLSQNSTDATHDLGQLVMKVSDEGGSDTKILGVVGNHPIKLTKKEVYNENGTYGIISDATSDGSFLDRAELHVGVASNTKTFGDVYSDYADWEVVIGDGENNYTVKYFNDDGDERDVAGGFTPSSKQDLLTAIDAELSARGITPSYNQPSAINLNENECSELSPRTNGMTADRLFLYNGENYRIRVANFSDSEDVSTAKISSLYFNCKDRPTSAETSQFFIGNPVSSVPKIMEDYLGAVVK